MCVTNSLSLLCYLPLLGLPRRLSQRLGNCVQLLFPPTQPPGLVLACYLFTYAALYAEFLLLSHTLPPGLACLGGLIWFSQMVNSSCLWHLIAPCCPSVVSWLYCFINSRVYMCLYHQPPGFYGSGTVSDCIPRKQQIEFRLDKSLLNCGVVNPVFRFRSTTVSVVTPVRFRMATLGPGCCILCWGKTGQVANWT